MEKLFAGLLSQLGAMEALGVGRQGPNLNARGAKLLAYLRARNIRYDRRYSWSQE